MVVFSFVIKRRDVVVRRDPDLLVKESETSVEVIEDVEVFNFVGLLTEVVFNGGSVLLKIGGRDEEELSVRVFRGG